MGHRFRRVVTAIGALLCAAIFVSFWSTPSQGESGRRPLLVTIDDLPISVGRLISDPEEREEVTQAMLDLLARHGIRAVGLVTWSNVRDESDLKLLEMWLEAGHELGNHSYFHLDLSSTEVADYIEMHESTVSRVTNQKYVQTPRGVFSLKYFFSSGLSTASGEDISARGVKDKIKSLVNDEDTGKPLTDQAIVKLLKADGVNIARLTVADDRDQLVILPARMRKRV